MKSLYDKLDVDTMVNNRYNTEALKRMCYCGSVGRAADS